MDPLHRLRRLFTSTAKDGLPDIEPADPKDIPEDEGDLDSKSAQAHRSEKQRLRIKEGA